MTLTLKALDQPFLPACRTPAAAVVQAPCTAVAPRRVDDPDERDPWTAAEAENRRQAIERRDAVRDWLDLCTRGYTQQDAADQVARYTRKYPALSVAGHQGATAVTVHNLRRWRRALGTLPGGRVNLENLVALLDGYRGGRTSYALECPEFMTQFARFYESGHRLTFATAHRYAHAACVAAGMHPETLPSVGQVERYYLNYRPAAVVRYGRARSCDERRAEQEHIERDYGKVLPGQCLVGDNRQIDAPIAVRAADGSLLAIRPWVIVFMCIKSRRVVAFAVSEVAPNRIMVLQVLWQACIELGCAPADLIIDNGKDYAALGVSKPVVWDGIEHSVCLDLGIRVHPAIPRNPEAKTVENLFSFVSRDFDKLLPGYRGNRPENRPDTAQAVWETPENLPVLDQMTLLLGGWFDRWYHPRPQNSRATGGLSPDQVWAEYRPARPALGEREMQLAFAIPLPRPRKVWPGGIVQVGPRRYRSEQLYDLVERQVFIRVPQATDDMVLCCRADGAVLCEARSVDSVPAICQSEDDYQQLAAAMRQKAHWLTHVRQVRRDGLGRVKAVPLVEPWKLLAPEATTAQILAAAERTQLADSAGSPHNPPSPGALTGRMNRLFSGASGPAESAPPLDAADAALLESLLRDAGAGPETPAAESGDLRLLAELTEAGGAQHE